MKYTAEDFHCDDLAKISPTLLRVISWLTAAIGYKLTITSGWRSEEHNTKVGGHPHSPHMYGMAVDIACQNSAERFNIIAELMDEDINEHLWGVGIYDKHIHIDVKPRNDGKRKMWIGKSK